MMLTYIRVYKYICKVGEVININSEPSSHKNEKTEKRENLLIRYIY